MRWSLLALVLLVGCKTKNDAAPGAAQAASVVSVASAPSASASASSAAADTPEKEVERVVRAWSDALDKHDVAALEKLYADPVFFYTKSQPKKTVLAMKKSVLGPTSTFHQQIMGKIEVTTTGKGYAATFTKRSGNGTKLGDTKALLVLSGTPLAIAEERDAPRPAESCETVAASVMWAIPAVKKAMDDVRKNLEKFPDRHEGGIAPMTMEDGTIVMEWGVHHPDRFERIVSYVVYPNGRLDVDAYGTAYTTDPSGETMDGAPAKKLSEADHKRVTAACGPPADSH
jgi:hypothetical protein